MRTAAPDAVLSAPQVRQRYDRLAPFYDAVAAAYGQVGAGRFHRRAVEALALRPGDTALDLACGTGANLPYLAEAVGPVGRVVGVDLSTGMVEQARKRVLQHGWENVELVCIDVRAYPLPNGAHGVVSTYGLEMVPEHEAVIERAIKALAPGGRIAVCGLRRPVGWPAWLVRLGEWVNHPSGVSRAYESAQPWHDVHRHAAESNYEEHLWGAVYLAVGTASGQQPTPAEEAA